VKRFISRSRGKNGNGPGIGGTGIGAEPAPDTGFLIDYGPQQVIESDGLIGKGTGVPAGPTHHPVISQAKLLIDPRKPYPDLSNILNRLKGPGRAGLNAL
jgi:hypothetical protein